MKKRKVSVPMQPEWLEGALPGRIQIHASGSASVLLENYLSVARFAPDCVSLRARDGLYRVEGEELTICEMRRGQLIVKGRVHRIAFPGGGEA